MDDLVLDWRKELGWQKNPFEQKIQTPAEDYLAGYEKEQQKLNVFVLNEKKYGAIQGIAGTGKSMLLLWLKETLEKHKHKFAAILLHHDDFKEERQLIEKLSEPFASETAMKLFFKKIMGKAALTRKNVDLFLKENSRHRRIYVLVDSAQLLGKEDYDLFSRLLRIDKCSVILASPKKDMAKDLPKDELSLELKKVDFEGAKAILTKRIEAAGGLGIWPFSDKAFKDLCGLGDYIPEKIIQLCSEKAKELAIEVKAGKIPRPEKKGIFVQHEVKVNDQKLEHPKVEKKHSGEGFGIKFVVIDEDKPHPRPVKDVLDARSPAAMEELAQSSEERGKKAEEQRTTGEEKTSDDWKSGEKKPKQDAPSKPEKKGEQSKDPREAKEKKEGKDDDFPTITIDLGYTEEKKKPEKKMEKKVFEIDISPVKKKK